MFTFSGELWPSLGNIGIAVGLVMGIVVMAVLLKRAPKVVPGASKLDRFGTALTAGGAVVVGIVALGNAIATTMVALTPGAMTIYDLRRMTAQVEPELMVLPHVDHASSAAVAVTITDAPGSIVPQRRLRGRSGAFRLSEHRFEPFAAGMGAGHRVVGGSIPTRFTYAAGYEGIGLR